MLQLVWSLRICFYTQRLKARLQLQYYYDASLSREFAEMNMFIFSAMS
jgi:hypothetical protein